jgi:isoleucyl-tRNA synthetase
VEEARNKKLIGQSLARVKIKANGDTLKLLKENVGLLPTIFITSQVEIAESEKPELEVEVVLADGEKCERCWIYSETVGESHEHPTLCSRCSTVINE